MKDLVVKTVLFTLAFIFGVIALVFCALALFSPITLAEAFDGTGGYSASIYFYEKNYEKTEDIDDLALLTLKINRDIDGELLEKYLEELISHPDFDKFCASEEGKELYNRQLYLGKYASALTKSGKLEKALKIAYDFVVVQNYGYTEYNPYSVILIEQGESLTIEQLDTIKTNIQIYSDASADLEYIEYLKSKL